MQEAELQLLKSKLARKVESQMHMQTQAVQRILAHKLLKKEFDE